MIQVGRLPNLRPARAYDAGRLARRLGVTVKTVNRWRIRGIKLAGGQRLRLRAYKQAGSWHYLGHDVLEWLLAQQPAGISTESAQGCVRPAAVDAELDAEGF